ncbi:MAG: YqgE/AlgH family protein [Marinifilaceae bacterium]|jgi:putative transcriptional regulator|nr:YqgE/AlgH family protein [Marinifilaceae bacterium]
MDNKFNILNFGSRNKIPQKGDLIISEPFLKEKYFSRSVILIAQDNENGVVGFILNKLAELKINQIIPAYDDKYNAFLGGPVENSRFYYIHRLSELIPNSIHIIGDLYWGGDFSVIKELIKEGRLDYDKIKFFVGYSGWKKEQLIEEVEENSWLICKMDNEFNLFLDFENMWKECMSSLGGKYQIWSEFPENPNMN